MTTIQAVSDSQLLESYQSGSQKAFETLVRKYQGRVFTTIDLIVKDKDLAADLTQDVFVRFFKVLASGRYRDDGKLMAYLLRIADNLAIDHYRRKSNRPMVREVNGKDIFSVINIPAGDAFDELEKRERHELLRHAIRQLSPLQQQLLTMRYFGKLSFAEISEITGINKNTCLGTVRRALIKLRTYLIPQSPEYDSNLYPRRMPAGLPESG